MFFSPQWSIIFGLILTWTAQEHCTTKKTFLQQDLLNLRQLFSALKLNKTLSCSEQKLFLGFTQFSHGLMGSFFFHENNNSYQNEKRVKIDRTISWLPVKSQLYLQQQNITPKSNSFMPQIKAFFPSSFPLFIPSNVQTSESWRWLLKKTLDQSFHAENPSENL